MIVFHDPHRLTLVPVTTKGTAPIKEEAHLIRVRELLRDMCRKVGLGLGLGLVDETKIVTAGSELARNILKYSSPPGGSVHVEIMELPNKKGLRAVFDDKGPGIADIELAMRDGFTTGRSLGLRSPGSRRLVDEFSIDPVRGIGTRMVIVTWAR